MIINALKDRFVCLKMDTATRFNHGVNAQFIEDEKFFINTLVLIELQKSHTSHNLCTEIQSLLDEFNIRKGEIYSTDNSRNMIKAVDLLNEFETDNGEIPHDELEEELTQHLQLYLYVI